MHVDSQLCPFCYYLNDTYKNTGSFVEAENWTDLCYFVDHGGPYSTDHYFFETKKEIERGLETNVDYKIKKRKYFIDNLSNCTVRQLKYTLQNDWDQMKIKDRDEFKSKWNGITVKLIGKIQNIEYTDYNHIYCITIDDQECRFKGGTFGYNGYIKSASEMRKSNSSYVETLEGAIRFVHLNKKALLDVRRVYNKEEIEKYSIGNTVTIIGDITGPYESIFDLSCCEFVE